MLALPENTLRYVMEALGNSSARYFICFVCIKYFAADIHFGMAL